MHAIEELYFFRRYEEARKVTEEVLKGKLNEEFRKVVVVVGYKERCEAKLSKNAKSSSQIRCLGFLGSTPFHDV